MVTTLAEWIGPKRAIRAAKGMAMPVTAQLELQTMKPDLRAYMLRWCGISERWLIFTVGTMSGMYGASR